MKYNLFLVVGTLIVTASSSYAIPKPPEMHPRASSSEFLDPRMEILDHDGLAVEVMLRGEVKLGENGCLAENNEAFLSQKRPEKGSSELLFEAFMVTNYTGKGKCEPVRLNPIFKTVEKSFWVEEESDSLIIRNPSNQNNPQVLFVRGQESEVRALDVQRVKSLASGKNVFAVTGQIYAGSNPCLASRGAPFFSVTRILPDVIHVAPKVFVPKNAEDINCTLEYDPQWLDVSVNVEADSVLDIVILNQSRQFLEFDEL